MTFCVCRICKTSGQVRTSRKQVNFIAIPDPIHSFLWKRCISNGLKPVDVLGRSWVCTKCHSRLKEYFEGLKNEN